MCAIVMLFCLFTSYICRRLVDTQKRLSSQEAYFNKQKEDSSKVITDMLKDIGRLMV